MGDLGFSESFVVWLLILGAVVVAVAVVAPFLPKPAERQMRRLVRDHTARWPAPPDLVESSYREFFAGAAALTRDDMSAARLAFRRAWALGLPAGYTGLGVCAWDLRDEGAAGRVWAVAGDAGDVPARVLAYTLRELRLLQLTSRTCFWRTRE